MHGEEIRKKKWKKCSKSQCAPAFVQSVKDDKTW